MKIQILSVNINYQDEQPSSVQVHFEGGDNPQSIRINGVKTMTPDVYSGNESTQALEILIKEDLREKS